MKTRTDHATIAFIRGRPGPGCTTRLCAYDSKGNELYAHYGAKARHAAAGLRNRGVKVVEVNL